MTRLAALLAALFLAAACGSEEPRDQSAADRVVEAAQRSLDERRSGHITFELLASAEGSDSVGFAIDGEYAFPEDRELTVLDLTYTQVLGDESQETRIVSDGGDAWVVVDGKATQLTAEQARSLAIGREGSSEAVPEMDLGAWLRQGKLEESGPRATVTGQVHASALIADLQRIAAQVAGLSGGELDEETAGQIDRSVETSSMEVISEQGALRAVKAHVDFGTEVPGALREALGTYAGATLELAMTVEDIETPLRVQPPDSEETG